jgi:hypothetical protein
MAQNVRFHEAIIADFVDYVATGRLSQEGMELTKL